MPHAVYSLMEFNTTEITYCFTPCAVYPRDSLKVTSLHDSYRGTGVYLEVHDYVRDTKNAVQLTRKQVRQLVTGLEQFLKEQPKHDE